MSNTASTRASSFAVTCNLLSKYIKENGPSLGDLALRMPIDPPIVKSDTHRPPTTMSLLPGVDVSENATKVPVSDRNATKSMQMFPQRSGFGLQTPPAAAKREPEKSQLTMFYKGKVLVFDNFPADKAHDLLILAGRGCGAAVNAGAAPNSAAVTRATVQTCPPKPTDLPIARKASLHRFLEKRKDRINANAPYQMNQGKGSPASAVAPKMEENRPWLGLSSERSR